MKGLFLIVSIKILFPTIGYSQKDSFAIKHVNQISSASYLQKGKHQTKAAVILAGSGFVLGTVALATFPKNYDILGGNSTKTENAASFCTALFFTGAALLITSIPYFIAGGINKRKANVIMKSENLSVSPHITLPIRQLKTGILITI